ncbi:translation initiation factor IF-2 [Vulpes lagopus]|uniref:translation initiation factor IF-2 n=1 Tax=Vulpes lagopus TaxID=494514 RepID=UPI001BC97ACC|nr:translation initiation factor IF-2 [Vulpes lagopus]
MVPARSWAAGPAPGAGRWAGSVAWRGPGVAPRAPRGRRWGWGGGEGACHLRPAERPLPRPRARAAPLPPRLPPSPRARAAVLPHAPRAGHRVRGTHERAVRAEQRENPLPHHRPAAAINVTRRDAPPPPPEKKKSGGGGVGGMGAGPTKRAGAGCGEAVRRRGGEPRPGSGAGRTAALECRRPGAGRAQAQSGGRREGSGLPGGVCAPGALPPAAALRLRPGSSRLPELRNP